MFREILVQRGEKLILPVITAYFDDKNVILQINANVKNLFVVGAKSNFCLDRVSEQLILSKLFLMNRASDSSENRCTGPIHSKFTLSCIGHVIDAWK